MKLALFLDDWLLDDRRSIKRRFPAAQFTRFVERVPGGGRVIWNASRGSYECIVQEQDSFAVWESADGDNWERGPVLSLRHSGEIPEGCFFNEDTIYALTGGFDVKSSVFADPYDKEHPYKLLIFPYTRSVDVCGGIEGGPGVVALSSDGINWQVNSKDRWFSNPKGSDTVNNIFYNPRRGMWQVSCRRYNNDRRIFMTESADLRHWSEPRVIIHPDAFDEPLMQFYGMPVICYEDEYFFGALQCYHVAGLETPEQHSQGAINSWSKWAGTVDNQLAYSYDGANWCRSDRTPFVPTTAPGTPAGSCIYAVQMERRETAVRIYSEATARHHGVRQNSTLTVHETRLDGFCCLESEAGWGSFITRCLTPRSGRLLLNYEAPAGIIEVQATDLERHPLPGFTFEECLPLTGDELYGEVRWRSGRRLDEFGDRRIRLEFRLSDARLYAMRLECGWWYTNTPQPIDEI